MPLEINKQYVANPALLQIEGEYDGPFDAANALANAQLRAMAYLKLNVFEVIFAVLPYGTERQTWVRYFEMCLRKSGLLGDELEKNREIYHASLIEAYDVWKKSRN